MRVKRVVVHYFYCLLQQRTMHFLTITGIRLIVTTTDRSANWLWNVDTRESFHQGDKN